MVFKICPICKAVFPCQPENIGRCQCASVQLTEGQRAYMRQHYTTCLCAKCLAQLPEK